MKSESSDIGDLLDRRSFAAAASKPGYSIASIAMQVEENKASHHVVRANTGTMWMIVCAKQKGSGRNRSLDVVSVIARSSCDEAIQSLQLLDCFPEPVNGRRFRAAR
jgi:hypothetical protein